MSYEQYYERIGHGANIIFDVTIQNALPTPLILSHVGVHIFAVAESRSRETFGAMPTAAPVPKCECYELVVPDIRSELTKGGRYDIEPTKIGRNVLLQLPDPIYFEGAAPFRFSLMLKHYRAHIPKYAICTLIARSDHGDSQSHFIKLRA